MEESDEALEAFCASGFVARDGVVRVFSGAHEAVACALVGDGLVFFAGCLHGCNGGRNGGTDTGVVASVEAIDGGGDRGDIGRSGAVEDEGRGEVFAVGREGEGLTTSPAETCDCDLSVGGGDGLGVVGCGVQVGVNDVGVETGDGFRRGVHAGEGVGAATVGAEAGEEIRGDDDEALGGQFVGHLFGPVTESEDFVDKDDDRGFVFDLGIDDEGLDGAVAVFKRDVFVVAWGGFEAILRPVLCMQWRGGEGQEQRDGQEEFQGARLD